MAEVKVLIKGYLKFRKTGKCRATISLIRDNKRIIICDPGCVNNPKVIINALKKEKIELKDVDYVFITHSHLDHYRNIGLFPKAKSIDYWGIWNLDGGISPIENFSRDIEVIKTPGHSYDGMTMLVRTKRGIFAVCGDLFWWTDKEEQRNEFNNLIKKEDVYSTDKKTLEKSRKLILQKADYIIPGHGEMFKVKK